MLIDKVYIGKHAFDTLVAITPDEHMTGLMNREWPPPVMTFPYKKAEIRKFWMKNTISPLDIIFIKSNKVAGIYEGKPLSLQMIGPDEPTDMVVELPLGTVAKLGISIGDNVKLCYSVQTAVRKMTYGNQ